MIPQRTGKSLSPLREYLLILILIQMNKERVLTQEVFDRLLSWLSPNREEAGKKYEAVRRRLIKIFACRGCCEAEELTDETINRVALKVEELAEHYVGDPALYFYGVAQKIHMEYLRKKPVPLESPPAYASEEIEPEYECLDHCMETLSAYDRELILQYYQEEKRAKINGRKALARQMGMALNALRIRAHRIRTILQQCVRSCLDQGAVE
jgi:DNA-directed RNA polymerase specialized sigma24 family protein